MNVKAVFVAIMHHTIFYFFNQRWMNNAIHNHNTSIEQMINYHLGQYYASRGWCEDGMCLCEGDGCSGLLSLNADVFTLYN